MHVLPKLTFRKADRVLILQGMRHTAHQHVYDQIQKDIDSAIQEEFVIFLEGIKVKNDKKSRQLGERKIRVFLKLLSSFYPDFAAGSGHILQDNLKYPDSVHNADIGMSSLVHQLWKNGCDKSLVVRLFIKTLVNPEFRKKCRAKLRDSKRKEIPILTSGSRVGLGSLVGLLLFRSLGSAILDSRNKAAVHAVISSPYKKILLHYGRAHVPGITQLLLRQGWTIIDKSHINL
jgi:hypothetical protein